MSNAEKLTAEKKAADKLTDNLKNVRDMLVGVAEEVDDLAYTRAAGGIIEMVRINTSDKIGYASLLGTDVRANAKLKTIHIVASSSSIVPDALPILFAVMATDKVDGTTKFEHAREIWAEDLVEKLNKSWDVENPVTTMHYYGLFVTWLREMERMKWRLHEQRLIDNGTGLCLRLVGENIKSTLLVEFKAADFTKWKVFVSEEEVPDEAADVSQNETL